MQQQTPKDNVTNDTQKFKSKRMGGRYYHDDTSRYAVTIAKTQDEVFAFWRNFENLSLFMKDLKNVQVISQTKSHWDVELKSGLKASWDAEITGERKNEMIAWRSLPGSEVEMTGSIWFYPAPAGRGTVVSLDMDVKPPGGKLTEFLTAFTGESPNMLIQINLARFKALMETGEIPTTEGQPSGRDENSETITKH